MGYGPCRVRPDVPHIAPLPIPIARRIDSPAVYGNVTVPADPAAGIADQGGVWRGPQQGDTRQGRIGCVQRSDRRLFDDGCSRERTWGSLNRGQEKFTFPTLM